MEIELWFRKKKSQRRKNKAIEKNECEHYTRGCSKEGHLHVFRLAPETSTETLKNCLNGKNFKNIECKKMVSKHPETYASFKVFKDNKIFTE